MSNDNPAIASEVPAARIIDAPPTDLAPASEQVQTDPLRPVKLGNVCRDPITGYTGTAIQMVEMLNGTIQYAVQPKCDPKDTSKMPEAYNFDTHLLEFVAEGLESKVTPPAPCLIKLGDKVQDRITGIKGIAGNKATFINGCIYFAVEPKAKDKKGADRPKGIFVSHDRLDVLEAASFQPTVVQTATVLVAGQKKPGGPTTPAYRMT